MGPFRFEECPDVEVNGVDFDTFGADERAVLRQTARFCQALVDADALALRGIVDEGALFTHSSGFKQTREEYIADVTGGALRYFSIGISHPRIRAEGDGAVISYTSVLNANAYGARGVYRMNVAHRFERTDDGWLMSGEPES